MTTAAVSLPAGTWHVLALTANGGTVTVEFDGVVLGSGTDSSPVVQGGIIFGVRGTMDVDDVTVSVP